MTSSDDLKLEKLKIHERLTTLELAIAKNTGKVEEVLDSLKKITECHEKILNGNGDGLGLRNKVLILEESEGRRTWSVRAIWLAVIALVADTLKDLFLHK